LSTVFNPLDAGDVRDPALVLTPDVDENGRALLKTGDIMPMHILAELVVLSGCDTAGPGENSAEALTGLARAFFFAGARDLLASNWPVETNATAALMISAFEKMKAAREETLPQTLRAAQLSMLSNPPVDAYTHPFYWSSFISVGDGELPEAYQ
jgi:CHAT domain-containing protein